MGMQYKLTNLQATIATAVLVRNLRDGSPTRPCNAEDNPAPAPPPATFVYYAWQFLNPSLGAYEDFAYGDTLSVIVRRTGGTDNIESKKTRVQIGFNYVLVMTPNRIVLQTQSQNGKGFVQITTPPPMDNPFTVEIEWYLGCDAASGRLAAATALVGPSTNAYFQPDSRCLLFLPVPGTSKSSSFAAADAASATSYLPPGFATSVNVILQLDATTQAPVYSFSPPKAVPST